MNDLNPNQGIKFYFGKNSLNFLFFVKSNFLIKTIFSIFVEKIQIWVSQFLLRRFVCFCKKALKSAHITTNITTCRSLIREMIRLINLVLTKGKYH